MAKYIAEKNMGEEYISALQNRTALELLGYGRNILKMPSGNYGALKKVLNEKRYKAAFQQLEIKYMPLHWRVFYGCARCGFTFGVYVLLQCIEKMIGR